MEIDFVKENLSNTQSVLELGAGYGRIIRELAPYCEFIVGIDISMENIELGKEYLKDYPNASIVAMDVHQIKFSKPFDVILCLQNGLSARGALRRRSIRPKILKKLVKSWDTPIKVLEDSLAS